MSSLRVLDLVKPFGSFLPEIISPERKPTFQTRITWTGKSALSPKHAIRTRPDSTGLTLLIFLVMSQVPLYGIVSSDSSDPLFILRMILASNRGTLMELVRQRNTS